jgi:Ca-activated chloride channel family protein
MTFSHPYLLFLLLLLPLLAWLKGRRGLPPAFLYSSVRLVEGLTRLRRSRAGALLAALRWLVLALFIVALAQPRLAKSTTEVKASGIDIMVALDMSGSMISEDFVVDGSRVNRFNMARSVLEGFIDQRPDDRIGLVVFASQAFVATPLTLDHDFLRENLDRLNIGTINPNQTAIGDALSAAQAAQALGVKVYTIGVGKQGMAPMPVGRNPFTGEQVYQNEPVDIDEGTLQKIAQMTGGQYYRADNARRFQQIYAEINKLEKTEEVINKFTQYRELFPWAVACGLVLLLTELVLGQTVFRKLP